MLSFLLSYEDRLKRRLGEERLVYIVQYKGPQQGPAERMWEAWAGIIAFSFFSLGTPGFASFISFALTWGCKLMSGFTLGWEKGIGNETAGYYREIWEPNHFTKCGHKFI